MASKAYQQVADLWSANPKWDANQITAALEGKIDKDQLNAAVNQYLTKVITQSIPLGTKGNLQKSISSAAANAGKFTVSADEFLKSVVSKAQQSDPTSLAYAQSGGTTNTLPPTGSSTGIPKISIGTPDFVGQQSFDNYFAKTVQHPNGLIQTARDKNGKTYVGMVNPSTQALDYVAIMGDPNDPSKFKVSDITTAIEDFKNYYLKDQKMSIKDLKLMLYKEGFTSKGKANSSLANNLIDGTMLDAMGQHIMGVSYTNFTNASLNVRDQFNTYSGGNINSPAKTLARTYTSSNTQLLDNRTAAMDFDQFAQKYLGRNATDAETHMFIQGYNDLASKHPTRSTITTDAIGAEKNRVSVGGVTQQDMEIVAVSVLSDSLRAAGKNPASISKLGGQIGRDINNLKKTAADYGLHYDDSMALNDAISGIQPGARVEDRMNILKNLAKVKYKNYASAIDAGVTIKDIADQYNALNNKYLENLTPTDVMSSDMQKALLGGANGNQMTTDEYVKYLKNKPEWAKTQNAREEASNYATTILKQFGMMA